LTTATFGHLELFALHFLELFLLIAGQNSQYIAFHIVSHLFHFLTDTFAASAAEKLTHAFSHLFHQASSDFLKLFFLRLSDFQFFGNFCVLKGCDALKLNVDFLQTLQLLRKQYFLKLLFHLGGAFLGLLSHFLEEFSSLFLANVAEVSAGPFSTALLLHFGQGFFLIGRNLQFGANGLNSQQAHRHVATTAASKHASAATTTAPKAASATSSTAAALALPSALSHRGSHHKRQ
jgi:hypothetical protein